MRKVFNFEELMNNTDKSSELSKELKFFSGGILYRIYNDTNNESYIGITKNLYSRIYSTKFGHLTRFMETAILGSDSKLYSAMRSSDIRNFYIEVIIFAIRIEDISMLEEYFINKFDSFNKGYNETPNGKASGLKNIAGIKGEWRFMHKYNGEDTLVPLNLVHEYEDNGYKLGRSKENYSKGTMYVNNGVKNKRIKISEIEYFLIANPGWSIGRIYNRVYDKGFKMLCKNGVKKKFRKDEIDEAYSNGWK